MIRPPRGACMSDAAERLYERLLVLRCQTGDDDAYRELVARFGPRLQYFLLKFVRAQTAPRILRKKLGSTCSANCRG